MIGKICSNCTDKVTEEGLDKGSRHGMEIIADFMSYLVNFLSLGWFMRRAY